jgi:hypothetical protein
MYMSWVIRFVLIFCLQAFCFNYNFSFACDPISGKEMTLKNLYEKLDKELSIPSKQIHTDSILIIWREVLAQPESFFYPFDSLKYIGKTYATDSTLRIFSWNIPKPDGTHNYYGFIQLKDWDNLEVKLFELRHDPSSILNSEDQLVGSENWYGCLYYDVIPVATGTRKYYTLLGFDLNNQLTNKKLIDMLYIENDVLTLGAPLFQIGRRMQSRVIFEYSSRAVMSLRYDYQKKMIVHDHLSPFQPRYEGQFQFYGPDFSFDGFVFENGRWKQVLDIDLSN